jgi:hypothetical protein
MYTLKIFISIALYYLNWKDLNGRGLEEVSPEHAAGNVSV